MKGKPILLRPSEEISLKVDHLSDLLRTSRSGVCVIALEFVLPLVESGAMAVINGKLERVKEAANV